MLRLAITGGLCSGKSTVSAMLRLLGCPVVDADAIGHELLQGGARAALVKQFGAGIVTPSGAISPVRLAELAFAPGADGALEALNRILHPPIMAAAMAELRQWELDGNTVAGVEAALLIEAGLLAGFDRVVLVVAPEEVRIERFIERTGGTRRQAEARMARQLPDAEKLGRAHCVINNDGTLAATERQVAVMLAQLRAEVTI